MPLLRFSLCAGRSETGDNALRSVDKTWQDEGNRRERQTTKEQFYVKTRLFWRKTTYCPLNINTNVKKLSP